MTSILPEAKLNEYTDIVGIKEYECRDEDVQQVLGQLPVLERTCLLLQIEGGFTIDEIAEIVALSEADVEALIGKGREQFRLLYHALLEQKQETGACPLLIDAIDDPTSAFCAAWREKRAALSERDLSFPEHAALASHLATCPACAERHKEYCLMDGRIRGVPTIKPASEPPAELLELWKEQNHFTEVFDSRTEGKNVAVVPLSARFDVFISYAPADRAWADVLEKHLSVLQWQGIISRWYDLSMSAGVEWEQEANTHLNTAQVVLLLISPDFLASIHDCGIEMKRVLERQITKEMYTILVLLRPVECESPHAFGDLPILPQNGRPVTTWRNFDEAFIDVMQGIRKVVSTSEGKGTAFLHQCRTDHVWREAQEDGYTSNLLEAEMKQLTSAGIQERAGETVGGARELVLRDPKALVIFDGLDECDIRDEAIWSKLWSPLFSFSCGVIFSYRVPAWRGQEQDLAEDVTQEAMRRVWERIRRTEEKETLPVQSVKRLLWSIASNFIRDLRRRDQRLLRIWVDEDDVRCEEGPPLDVATENLYQEEIFTWAAREISRFPDKQRRALLIDLANRMHFGGQPTPLQEAFLKAGICLEDYQHPLPLSGAERARYSSHLSLAYKRLSQSVLNRRVQGQRIVPREWYAEGEEEKHCAQDRSQPIKPYSEQERRAVAI